MRIGRASLVMGGLCAVLTAPAHAAAPSRFDIPAGPLEHALTEYSAQSDREILFSPSLVAGLKSRGISGRRDSDAVLDLLLRGSGLTWRTFQGRILIERQPAVTRLPQPVIAPEQTADIDGVIITALRRPTMDQLTPMSVRAMPGAELARAGILTFERATALTPGVVSTPTGVGRNRLTLRGVYGSGESTTALYYDDVPVTGASGTTSDPGSSFPELLLVDVDRLELLRGPQGTLHGASAMGGALKVMFNRPDLGAFSGRVEGEVSANAGHSGHAGTLVLNQPLVDDVLGMRMTAYRRAEPAFTDNSRLGRFGVNATTTTGVRLGVGAKPTETLTVNFLFARQEDEIDDTSAWTTSGGSYVSTNYARLPFESRFTFYSGSAEWRTLGARLSAMAATYRWNSTRRGEYTGVLLSERTSPAGCRRYFSLTSASCTDSQLSAWTSYVDSRTPGLLHQPVELQSRVAEIRAASDNDGFIGWTFGLFGERRDDSIDSQVLVVDPTTGLPQPALGYTGRRLVDSRFSQRAAYGEITLGEGRDTSLVLGARRFDYKRQTIGRTLIVNVISNTAEGNFDKSTGEKGWSLKVVGSHRLSDRVMTYAQASQGFRPGGVNTVPGLPEELAAYRADSLWNYELGLKGAWLNGRLTVNTALYRIDWRDMQYTAGTANGAFNFLTNLGQARIEGAEADVVFDPPGRWRTGLNLAYADAMLTKDQATAVAIGLGSAGDRLPVVPRISAGGWAEYERPLTSTLDLSVRADATYTGSSHSAFASAPADDTRLGDMLLVNLRMTVKSQAWSLGAYAENLLDDDAASFATTGRQPQIFGPRPRRLGVVAGYSF
ncbi:TonB-dependent receptor plug domain-containing protein [Caulobacter sp. NIBR2454]|uniref:TonB-dependent receptor plug domain-containing protein n=1 Tax=Caulobacter sp. NIBR2454 TaxID=3015996 RepID=UPI0022B5F9B8|nr:TonB-dependent receptor [Caulobacter sp. NIBR2454]